MAISSRDTIVHGPQIGRCGDEVDVVVGVIIFLELHGVEAVANKRRRGW